MDQEASYSRSASALTFDALPCFLLASLVLGTWSGPRPAEAGCLLGPRPPSTTNNKNIEPCHQLVGVERQGSMIYNSSTLPSKAAKLVRGLQLE